MSNEKKKSSSPLLRRQRRYHELKKSIVKLGYVCPGSVVERYMPCGKSNCRCAADPANRHGPYYEWSRKVRGKTVTIRLSEQAAELYKEFTRNYRICKKLFNQMQSSSMGVAKTMADEMKVNRG